MGSDNPFDRSGRMIQVAAAVIEKQGKVLIARRGGEGPFAGMWEFPGGKVEPGETSEQGLARELREELGIRAQVGAFLCASRHDYGHLAVELLAYRVSSYQGEIRLSEHTEIRWVWPRHLSLYEFPAADLPIIRKIVESS